jgi:type I restriction enzyme S subunit
MSEWRKYLLEDVIEKFIDYRGKTPDKKDSGIPLVTAKIVKAGKILPPNEFIAPEDYDSWMTRGLPEIDDIVLTTEAPLGEIALIKNKNVALAQRIITLRGKKDIVFNPFLKYYFQDETGQHELQSRASGTTVFGIKASVLKKVPVNLPDLKEQKAIAAVLSSLDDKIDLLHRQNKTLETMAETLFKQWFVVEAREDWEEKPLGDFVKVIDNRGKTPPYQDIPTPYPIIEVNALTGKNRLVDYSAIRKYVSEETFNTWFRGHPKKFDFLISTVGSIGEISMFLVEKGSIAQNVVALSAINISPIYLFEFLKNAKDEIKELDIGSVQPSIKVPHLLSIKITVPPIEKIELFDNQVKSYLEKMLVNDNQIQTLEILRDNLLPKLMSGEVRVKM